jgi:hypothetical protein
MQSIITKAIQKNHNIIFIEPYRDALEEHEFQVPNTLDKFKEFQLRNFVQFYYTEFENYIYKCIREILVSSPGKMSKKQISIGEIIKYNYDAKRIIEFKAERVVEDLLKKPFKRIFEIIDEEYNIKHNLTKEELRELNKFYQIRNIFAHRSGIIDKRFIDNFGEEKYKEGDLLKLKSTEINDYCQLIENLLYEFDHALSIAYPNFVSFVP